MSADKLITIECSVCGWRKMVRKSWWFVMCKPLVFCERCELLRDFEEVE